ncbi:FAD-dependent monooxygenase [Streptomyces sp. LHD-70]|uniref:FAD-dependent monooxygenase n=1 Tax=Streptomyces sp. LHD-70 TaxID=3072140 RepID=UPI00280FAFF2|nr:FAD-dependent monooxygenase [Streptomyces sp. LHD-70]MDQ8705171.1 FAD-dependent monooxygenase [Streptomyces sp. LHD-70]
MATNERSSAEETGVLIAGAGIGGLTAALALHAEGVRVTVVERVRRITPLGVGISLQPHAVRELTRLGLGDTLAATGVPTAEQVYADERGGRRFAEAVGTAAGYRWPQYAIHRGELQLLLLDAVRERLGPDAVRTGTCLESFAEERGAVRVTVTDRATGATALIEARALVGADGARSRVRAALHPDEGPMCWSGARMWRGVTETAPFLTGRTSVIASGGRNVQLVVYPISARRPLLNWVCAAPEAEPGPLAENAGWNREGSAADVLRHLEGWDFGPLGLDIHALITGSGALFAYPMVDRDPLPRWGRGRTTLLGDAAHPLYPTGANGASQAIVDARALATELAAELAAGGGVVAGGGVAAALARYEAARVGPTGDVLRANREMDRSMRGRVGGDPVAAITERYRRATGGDATAVNAKA